MLEYFKTETDQVFDDIIYSETHPNVPQQQYFLHSTTATTQPVSSLKKKDKAPNGNRLYTSPFRSDLTPDELEWSEEIKYQKYSHTIEYPEYLNILDQLQTQELNELRLKERQLAYYKASQEITKYDKSKYKYIKQPLPLDTIPKVPYFTYKSTKRRPESIVASKFIAKQNNPWATPENKEKIIIYKGKFYSKPIFDNVQYDQLIHDRFIRNEKKNYQDRKSQLEKKYNAKIMILDDKISKSDETMKEMKLKHNNFQQFYENNLTKQYFVNVASFNNRKTEKLNHISKLKKFISDTPVDKVVDGNDGESFEYETVEEIKYV